MSEMIAVIPRGNYKTKEYPSFAYRMRNRNALKYVSQRIINIARISDNLFFVKPLPLNYLVEDGYYTADICVGGLIIASAEESLAAMVEDIKSQFSHAWNYYALESDDNLTEGAQNVKRWLLGNVRSL